MEKIRTLTLLCLLITSPIFSDDEELINQQQIGGDFECQTEIDQMDEDYNTDTIFSDCYGLIASQQNIIDIIELENEPKLTDIGDNDFSIDSSFTELDEKKDIEHSGESNQLVEFTNNEEELSYAYYLYKSILFSDIKTLKKLIKEEIDLNSKLSDFEIKTLVSDFSKITNLDETEYGNLETWLTGSALILANNLNNKKMVQLLIKNNSKTGITDTKGNTVLHYAAVFGNADFLEEYISVGIKDSINNENLSPIQLSVLYNNKECYKLLYSNGYLLNSDTITITKKQVKFIVKLFCILLLICTVFCLIEFGFDIHEPETIVGIISGLMGLLLLVLWIVIGNTKVYSISISDNLTNLNQYTKIINYEKINFPKNSDVVFQFDSTDFSKDEEENSAIEVESSDNDIIVLDELIVEHVPTIYEYYEAVILGKKEKVTTTIENGIDVNSILSEIDQEALLNEYIQTHNILDSEYNSLKLALSASTLNVATALSNYELMLLLIENKVNLNVRDKDGNTPLLIAVFNKDTQAIKILETAGANRNIVNLRGEGTKEYYNELEKNREVKINKIKEDIKTIAFIILLVTIIIYIYNLLHNFWLKNAKYSKTKNGIKNKIDNTSGNKKKNWQSILDSKENEYSKEKIKSEMQEYDRIQSEVEKIETDKRNHEDLEEWISEIQRTLALIEDEINKGEIITNNILASEIGVPISKIINNKKLLSKDQKSDLLIEAKRLKKIGCMIKPKRNSTHDRIMEYADKLRKIAK